MKLVSCDATFDFKHDGKTVVHLSSVPTLVTDEVATHLTQVFGNKIVVTEDELLTDKAITVDLPEPVNTDSEALPEELETPVMEDAELVSDLPESTEVTKKPGRKSKASLEK